jgi:hypothetical protein
MNEEQLEKIEEGILRLINIKKKYHTSYLRLYVQGRIDSLKWVKENI